MYEDIYSPIPDIDRYLSRIGLEKEGLRPDLETLGRIIRGHLAHIPFENLDAWDRGQTPLLGIEDLFRKMILGRRGGWCFELNGLLHALLKELGYQVYGVGVRVMVGRNPHALVSHHGEIVCLEGRKYYCDVGFGTLSMPNPIPLDGEETCDGFRAEESGGEFHIYRRYRGEEQYLMRFEDRVTPQEDYTLPNFFNAQNTALPFRQRLSVSLQDGLLRRQLVDHCMKEYWDGELRETVTAGDRAELAKLLEEKFGIEYDFE